MGLGFSRSLLVSLVLSLVVFSTAHSQERCPGEIAALTAKLIASELSMDNIRNQLGVLSGEAPVFVRYKLTDRCSESNKELCRYHFFKYLQSLGYEVKLEPFTEGMNFYVELRGTVSPDEVYEVTAHYDTVSSGVPGADDNGSGIGALMEIARVFKKHPPQKTLRIVFMDLEEKGFHGSRAHAKALVREFFPDDKPHPTKKFLGSLVLDTIGWNPSYPTESRPLRVVLEVGQLHDFGSYMHAGSRDRGTAAYALSQNCASDMCFQFLSFADGQNKRDGLNLTVESLSAKGGTADHGAYWNQGLPAVLLAAPYEDGYINPGYHNSRDTISGMNWDYYTRVMGFVLESIARLTHATPELVNSRDVTEYVQSLSSAQNVSFGAEDDVLTLLDWEKARKLAQEKKEEEQRARDRLLAAERAAQAEAARLADPPLPASGMHSSGVILPVAERWMNEKPIDNLIVVVEHDGRNAVVLDEIGDDAVIGNEELMGRVISIATTRGVRVARKISKGSPTISQCERLAKWLEEIRTRPVGTASAIPYPFELLEKSKLTKKEKKGFWAGLLDFID